MICIAVQIKIEALGDAFAARDISLAETITFDPISTILRLKKIHE